MPGTLATAAGGFSGGVITVVPFTDTVTVASRLEAAFCAVTAMLAPGEAADPKTPPGAPTATLVVPPSSAAGAPFSDSRGPAR